MNIAASADPPLRRAAALLPRSKQLVFDAAYHAMRRMDDFVDDDFLRRPAGRRATSRAAAHRELRRRLDEAFTLPIAQQNPRPWRALATALARDVDERPVRSWHDFRSYALGAAVAPGMVFVQILAEDPAPPARALVPLALFCYLTHILRDLHQDARSVATASAEQRLTVPLRLLGSVSRSGFAEALLVRDPSAVAIVHAMVAEAARIGAAAAAATKHLCTALPADEAAALRQLHDDYATCFAFMSDDPERIVDGRTRPPADP